MTRRPRLTPRPYTWKNRDQTETAGIGLMRGAQIQAHMTFSEARTLADRLHDLVDAAGNPEPVLESIPAEKE